jgi:hypothetical protein
MSLISDLSDLFVFLYYLTFFIPVVDGVDVDVRPDSAVESLSQGNPCQVKFEAEVIADQSSLPTLTT